MGVSFNGGITLPAGGFKMVPLVKIGGPQAIYIVSDNGPTYKYDLDLNYMGTFNASNTTTAKSCDVDSDGNVYTADWTGIVKKWNPDGSLAWEDDTNRGLIPNICVDWDGNSVYVRSASDDIMREYNKSDGALIDQWASDFPTWTGYETVVHNGNVWAIVDYNNVVKYDSDGNVLWTSPTSTSPILDFHVDDTETYLYTSERYNGNFFKKIRISDGNIMWSNAPRDWNSTRIQPDSQGNVYGLGYYGLYKYDSDGNEQWRDQSFSLDHKAMYVDNNDNVYVATNPGLLRKYDGSSATPVASIDISGTDTAFSKMIIK